MHSKTKTKTKGYKIEHTSNTNSYTLYLLEQTLKNNYIHELYESITKTNILSNVFISDSEADNDLEEESISFTAESVKPLTTFLQKGKLTNQETIKMIHDLSKQIAYLESNLLAFYGYNLDDILVINDETFFIASMKCISKIESTSSKCIYFYNPIIKPYFSNPELDELTKLPAKIDYRSSYYSLGALILFCSTNIYIYSELKEIDVSLSPIYYTKLYWFLKRTFHKNGKQRILLFI